MTTYAFDTEWTDRDAPEIIEAAWIRMPETAAPDVIDIGVMAPFQTYEERYCPAGKISWGAMAVHHILPDELVGKRPSTAFELPIDVTYLVGHSIDSDWEVAGRPAHVKRICTYAIAQHLFDEAGALSLSALTYFTQGATPYARDLVRNAHGAMQDCWNVVHLLRAILALKPEVKTWSQLWELSEACRVPLRMPMGKSRGALLSQLESSEICWYLDRDFIDPYLRKGLENVLASRSTGDLFEDYDEDFGS